MEIINTVFSVKTGERKRCEWWRKKDKTQKQRDWREHTHRDWKKEIINKLFLSAGGTKTGFFRLLLTRTMQGQVGTQCVCVCMRVHEEGL